MKNAVTAALALSAILLFTSGARANPDWYDGFPKTGTNAGTILVRATANFAAGTTTNGTVIVKYWNTGGGAIKQQNFTIKANQTGPIDTGELTVTGLTSGQKYNVTITIQGMSGGVTYNFTADPGTATAK
jgi:hypothetical protein